MHQTVLCRTIQARPEGPFKRTPTYVVMVSATIICLNGESDPGLGVEPASLPMPTLDTQQRQVLEEALEKLAGPLTQRLTATLAASKSYQCKWCSGSGWG